MRKPIEQKPPLAAWATTARDEAGMSVEEVVDALGARGHAITAATIRGIEGGSKGASVRLRRLLAEVYGRPMPGLPEPAVVADTAAVVAAIDRLSATMERAVREMTDSQTAGLGELTRVMLEVLGPLAAGIPPDGDGRAARQQQDADARR